MTTITGSKKGFFLAFGKKACFLESATEKRTAKQAREMIKGIAKYRGFCEDLTARILADPETVQRIQRDMQYGVMEYKTTDGVGDWISVRGRNFGGGYDPAEIIEF